MPEWRVKGYVGGYVRSVRQSGVSEGYVGRICRKGRRHNTVKLVPRAQMVPDVCRMYVGSMSDKGTQAEGCESAVQIQAPHQGLPKALVQGSPLYKGRGKSHVPIKKINVPIFRVSCPYRKNQCPYLFGQIYVIFCFNLGTKFASMICGSFLFHFQRRSMRHEADASAYTYNNYNTCLIYMHQHIKHCSAHFSKAQHRDYLAHCNELASQCKP